MKAVHQEELLSIRIQQQLAFCEYEMESPISKYSTNHFHVIKMCMLPARNDAIHLLSCTFVCP